jgi:DNA (cytosine-5)-methyltransferase 1
MAYFVACLTPKIFLFENVKGLLSAKWTANGKKGEIWDDVKRTFEDIGEYEINYALVTAKDYGVPQNRPRVLLVGIRKDVYRRVEHYIPQLSSTAGGFLPDPNRQPMNLIDVLGDLVDPEFKNGGKTEAYPNPSANAIQDYYRTDKAGVIAPAGAPLTEQEYSKHATHVIEKFQYMINNEGKIPTHLKTKKFAQRLLLPEWEENGPNITATSLADDYVHFSQPRILTVREWARLQGFPDWYEFKGSRTTGGLRRAGNPKANIYDRELPKYTQIGNAVPVFLAQAVGHHFDKILSFSEEN